MFSKNQLIIIGVGLLLLMGGGAIVLLSGGGGEHNNQNQQIPLTIFGTESRQVMNKLIEEYQKVRPNIQINYQELNPATYERAMIDALASGNGPDIVMFRNDWLTKHQNKLAPVSPTQFAYSETEELFPRVVVADFTREEKVYALPLYIDTLALFYNKNIFDAKNIAFPPKTWEEFVALIPKLREVNQMGQITKAAAALGGTSATITHMDDLLALLLLQAGNPITANFGTGALVSQNGREALEFYTQFATPQKANYTWNDNLGTDLDAFASERTAMIFGYAEDEKIIKNKNPFLAFGASPIPQRTPENPVNMARYWGLGVSNQSKNAAWAWDFIVYVTKNASVPREYLRVGAHPPALREHINEYLQNSEFKTFASQALTATESAWQNPDPSATPAIFSQMVESVLSGRLTISQALEQANAKLNAFQ